MLWGRQRMGVWAGGIAVALLSIAAAAWVLELGRAGLSLPWNYAGASDTKFYLLLLKGLIGHGSYQSNPSLGAPFGLQLQDFPQSADNLNLLLIQALGLLSSNPAWVLNVFFLLTFPLTALSAFLVLRRLGASTGAAAICGAIFVLLPYHFYRGESQMLLSAYYSVPLGALLFMRLWDEQGLWARRDGPAPRVVKWASRRSLLSVAACVVIGSAGLYYAVFALLLLIGGSVVALAARRGWRVVAGGSVAALLIAATLAVNLAPSLAYRAEHGKNRSITRTTMETDQFGLRLGNLLLPVREHRLPALSDLNQRYTEATATGYCESCFESLGGVGGVGFVWLCLVALVCVVGTATAATVTGVLYRRAALGVALAFVIATVGGVSGLIAFFLSQDIRGWNRMSLFIAFFSLLAVALLLDGARGWLSGRRAGGALGGLLLAVILVLGVWDETSAYFVPPYGKDAALWRSDTAFVRAIEARLPSGAAVFQIPYVPYPEGYGARSEGVSPPQPSFGTTYELARGPIHSEDLRWSYGAMKGRAADWQGELANKPLYLSLTAAAADGFGGLWVDPHGYTPPLHRQLAPLLRGLLEVDPLRSPRGDLLFFDLRPFAARLTQAHTASQIGELRQATLYPLRTRCEAGGLELTNPSSTTRTATLTMTLDMRPAGATLVLVHYPDGSVQPIPAESPKVTLSRRLSLPPGESAVRFSFLGTPQSPRVRRNGPTVSLATLTEDALTPFEIPPARWATARMPAGTMPPPCQQRMAAVRLR